MKAKRQYMELYYCNIDNFGDKLNEYIFKQIFGIEIKHSSEKEAEIIGIGSILDKILKRNFNFFVPKNKLTVFGSGFGFSYDYYRKKIKYAYPLNFRRKLNILALRGFYSKHIAERILKKDLDNIVLGDPGLLVHKLVDYGNVIKKYDVGIVPHYADQENPIFNKLNQSINNSVILNTLENPITFLYKLAECKTVISTAMHPLIACDALGIPNKWIRISELTTSRFKFKDYYSIYNIMLEPLLLTEKFSEITKDFIESQYKVPREVVTRTQNALIDTFNRYLEIQS